jgi:hypothetical protein
MLKMGKVKKRINDIVQKGLDRKAANIFNLGKDCSEIFVNDRLNILMVTFLFKKEKRDYRLSTANKAITKLLCLLKESGEFVGWNVRIAGDNSKGYTLMTCGFNGDAIKLFECGENIDLQLISDEWNVGSLK